MKTEMELIKIAQTSMCIKEANEALKELKERFDKTYMFCSDCDYAVVKETNCCLKN